MRLNFSEIFPALESAGKRAISWFYTLSRREQSLVAAVGLVGIFYLVMIPITAIRESIEVNNRVAEARAQDYALLSQLVVRYHQLAEKIRGVEESYANAEMTVDQVYSELPQIIKESTGSDNFDLKKIAGVKPLGPRSEKQDFTLRINSITLEQLVDLLHKFEHGKVPLFLGKVDINRAGTGAYSVALEIGSIQKRRESGGENPA